MKERRRAKRLPILETFSLFAAIPVLGPVRLSVTDVSELGMGLMLTHDFDRGKIGVGADLDVALFLNQSLSIPIEAKVVRSIDVDAVGIQLGLEFSDRKSSGFRAVSAFLKMLDEISSAVAIAKTRKLKG